MTDGNVLARRIDSGKPQFVAPEIETIATEAMILQEVSGLFRVIPGTRSLHLREDFPPSPERINPTYPPFPKGGRWPYPREIPSVRTASPLEKGD